MPVYSVSRTSQYTTVAALETKTNQDGFSWDANPLNGNHSFFVVTRTTVCPDANRTWDYAVAASPTPAYGPIAPVAPVEPVAPAGPVAPVAPGSPCAPFGPGGPAGPSTALEQQQMVLFAKYSEYEDEADAIRGYVSITAIYSCVIKNAPFLQY